MNFSNDWTVALLHQQIQYGTKDDFNNVAFWPLIFHDVRLSSSYKIYFMIVFVRNSLFTLIVPDGRMAHGNIFGK